MYSSMSSSAINLRRVAISQPIIFRTGGCESLSDEDADALVQAGVRHFVDLRSRSERARYGYPVALSRRGVRHVRLPLTGYPSQPIDKARPTSQDYVQYYLGMAGARGPRLRRIVGVVRSLLDEPILVGCHCGKDRTGVVVALTLRGLGLDADLISRDYALSGERLLAHLDRYEDKWTKRGHAREDYATRFETAAETMRSFLDRLATDSSNCR
ncbi:MAG: tyrosine-protein phosphatase [Rubrivivax sp.]